MNFPSTNPKPCSHLADYRQTHRRRLYRSLSSAAPKPRCGLCSRAASRLYLCLTCSSLSCFDHAMAHSVSDPRHDIAVDIDRLELFCFACADQIYDPDFDSAVDKKIAESDSADRGRKRRAPWDSGKNPASSSGHSLGLRGLSNLGSTCFMNSVLQALLHTPPLRDYFLGDGHNRESCRQKRGRRRMVVGGGEIPCLACDVDAVFSAVFSGDGTPFSPAGFLYSWWRHSANLASYEQQDAHEFFISILDRVHEKEQSSLKNTGIGDCHCIAHRVFSGTLRSDVTCTVCGFTSTTYDPCVDLSLDLESIKPNECSRVSTLVRSLDLFTRPEKLGSDQKLYCQHCRVSQDSVKQMSIRRLPLVLCFHIKRFEHSLIRKSSRKIDRYLQFPFSLDMTPYLSSSIVRSRFGNRIFAEVSSELSSEFEVFAVVTHAGWLESGHYVAYLRLRNQWYKCDDAWITQVSEGTVRSLQVYMIYYVQKVIYDRADEGDVGAKNPRKAVRLGSS